jgi:diphthine synthase
MSIPTAVAQLLSTEAARGEGVLAPSRTLAIALSRVCGGAHERIVAGTLQELLDAPPEVYGDPLHSLVLVGKRVHPLEVEYAQMYALDVGTWRGVAREVYGCALE